MGDDNSKKRDDGQARPTRDANGRWTKGHCPNPKGRPRKKPEAYLDQSDIRSFAETPIEVRTSDGAKVMSRRAALAEKMFQDAMNGKVSMQRFLYREFERSDEDLAELRLLYEQLMTKWVIENEKFDGLDGENIPHEVQFQISKLQLVLDYYFPGEYLGLPIHGRNNDGD